MKQALHLILYVAVLALTVGCTGSDKRTEIRQPQPTDTTYTQKAAMAVYDYQPVRALQIIDSAVIVGNISEVRADVERARIYSMTQAKSRLDSLLHGPEGTCLDSGRVVGERLLAHDSLKHDLNLRQQLLEILVYTARMQQDTLTWMQRSHELVDVCHEQGLQTEALRTEAELGASLCYSGQMEQGMTQLDSVITALRESPSFKFNELDAFIIASKRKIGVLNSMKRFAETLPLSHRIKELLDDYEQHPDKYHDGSHREPKDSTKRADYIRFYRSQAQNFVTAAYAALGERGSMEETFYEIESTVRDATTREHQARYHALEQQMEAERQRANAQRNALIAWGTAILLVAALAALVWYWRQKRIISRKNRTLVRQIDEAIKYKERYEQLHWSLQSHSAGDNKATSPAVDLKTLSHSALFQYLCDDIREKRLYLAPQFDRQAVCDRYGLSAVQVGNAFAQGSDYDSVSDFVRDCRLEYACRLLTTTDMKVADVASASGFSRATTFNHDFKARYNLTPSEYRRK